MSDTPRTDIRRQEILRDYCGVGDGSFSALGWWAEYLERELSATQERIRELEVEIAALLNVITLTLRDAVDSNGNDLLPPPTMNRLDVAIAEWKGK